MKGCQALLSGFRSSTTTKTLSQNWKNYTKKEIADNLSTLKFKKTVLHPKTNKKPLPSMNLDNEHL